MIKKLTFLSFILALSACVDLKEDPVQQLQNEYFQDLNSLRAAVSGTYKFLISDNFERSVQVAPFRVPLMGADDFTTRPGANKEDWRQFDQFYASSGNDRLARTWDLMYDVIRQANWDIEGAASLRSIEDPAEVDEIVAESHFLRSWCYFWMVRLFGGVPIITSTEFSEDLYELERSSVEEVYELIIQDLEFASEHLPQVQPAYGFVNQWVAKSYLAEVHLTMAGWPLKQTEHYEDAALWAKDVLDNSGYALMSDYPSIFLQENEGNNEILWAIPLCELSDCGTGFRGSFMAKATKPQELQGYEDMLIELSFFERFPEGVRKDFSILTTLKVETGDESDPFYVRTTEASSDTIYYEYIDYTQFTSGHPALQKYWDNFYDSSLVADDPAQVIDPLSSLDLPMLRLAKVQLMYAEAQARADNNPSAESYEYLNQIRRRALGDELDDAGSSANIAVGSLTTDEFVRTVVDEKGWELLGELNRWFDLTRTERVEEVNALRSPDEVLVIQNTIDQNRYYAPIPATEIALNPNLKQNDGY